VVSPMATTRPTISPRGSSERSSYSFMRSLYSAHCIPVLDRRAAFEPDFRCALVLCFVSIILLLCNNTVPIFSGHSRLKRISAPSSAAVSALRRKPRVVVSVCLLMTGNIRSMRPFVRSITTGGGRGAANAAPLPPANHCSGARTPLR